MARCRYPMGFAVIALCFAMLQSPAHASAWDSYNTHQQRRQVLATAQKQYNNKNLRVQHKTFHNDCSGFVKSVLWANGHSLDDFYRTYQYRTNGVALIYKYIERVGLIYHAHRPQKGDIVFFANTYDKNRDGKVNDPLTHIGIVESIDHDGTIAFLHYIHNRVRRGYMNFNKPRTYLDKQNIINTYLRRKNNYTSKTLAAQLFQGFGRLQPGR